MTDTQQFQLKLRNVLKKEKSITSLLSVEKTNLIIMCKSWKEVDKCSNMLISKFKNMGTKYSHYGSCRFNVEVDNKTLSTIQVTEQNSYIDNLLGKEINFLLFTKGVQYDIKDIILKKFYSTLLKNQTIVGIFNY